MAVFNFGSGFTSGSYGYTNGAYSSSTNIVNGVAYTRNVLNLGGNGCNSGPNYCQEGYSFFIPCIKNITRGQNVCFQFYIADKLNQDTLDLGDFGNSPDDCGLEALTVQLTGPFGCAYNTYTYPDDIKSLQYDEFSEIVCDGFDGNIYHLDLGYLEFDPDNHTLREIPDKEVSEGDWYSGYNADMVGYVGEFFEGEVPNLEASDSTTHIFVGWTTPEILSNLCANFTVDDLVFSTDRKWNYGKPITEDVILYAVYRPRRKYIVKTSFENRHSFFMFMSDDRTIMLSDKVRDFAEVYEGHYFYVDCCPTIFKDKDGETYTYNFKKWPDGEVRRMREYFASDDIFTNGELNLLAYCWDEKVHIEQNQNIRDEIPMRPNNFRSCKATEKEIRDIVVDYFASDNVIDYKGVMQSYGNTDDNYIILSKDGYLIFDAEPEGVCDLRMVMTIDTSNLPDPPVFDIPVEPLPDDEENQEEEENQENQENQESENASSETKKTTVPLRCEAMDRFYENNFAYQEWLHKQGYHKHGTPKDDEGSESDSSESESEFIEPEIPKISIGDVMVKNGNTQITASIYSKEDNELIFDFKNCEDGVFEITTNVDELRIDNICVYVRTIINKGKMELCIPPEDTLKFYTGILNMNGVISVCGNTFGMDSVQIGVVNGLNPISIATK